TLVEENRRRGTSDPEFELLDTGLFDSDRYFDVEITYAKAAPDDILIEIVVTNRGPDPAPLHILPHLWARNTWSWKLGVAKPMLRRITGGWSPAAARRASVCGYCPTRGGRLRRFRCDYRAAAR